MNIVITNTPPTIEQIAQVRREALSRLTDLAVRGRLFGIYWYGFAALVLGTTFATWSTGYFSVYINGVAEAVIVVTILVAGALMGAVGVIGTGGGALMWAVVFAVTVAFAGAFVGAVAFVGAALLGLAVLLGGAVANERWINAPRSQTYTTIESLTDLEHSELPDECITFVKWCEEDTTLKTYQHQLATMGRHPILAEYEAAMEWMTTREERKSEVARHTQAKQACERLRHAL